MTYTNIKKYSGKDLLKLYCNSFGYQNLELNNLKQEAYFNTELAKHNKCDQEWIAY